MRELAKLGRVGRRRRRIKKVCGTERKGANRAQREKEKQKQERENRKRERERVAEKELKSLQLKKP